MVTPLAGQNRLNPADTVRMRTGNCRDFPRMSDRSISPADVLDVHVLDLAAHVEALLRDLREIQRDLLRVRGVLPPPSGSQPMQAVHDCFQSLLRDCHALCDAARAGAETAAALDGRS